MNDTYERFSGDYDLTIIGCFLARLCVVAACMLWPAIRPLGMFIAIVLDILSIRVAEGQFDRSVRLGGLEASASASKATGSPGSKAAKKDVSTTTDTNLESPLGLAFDECSLPDSPRSSIEGSIESIESIAWTLDSTVPPPDAHRIRPMDVPVRRTFSTFLATKAFANRLLNENSGNVRAYERFVRRCVQFHENRSEMTVDLMEASLHTEGSDAVYLPGLMFEQECILGALMTQVLVRAHTSEHALRNWAIAAIALTPTSHSRSSRLHDQIEAVRELSYHLGLGFDRALATYIAVHGVYSAINQIDDLAERIDRFILRGHC